MADISSLLSSTVPLSWAAAISPVTLSVFLIMVSMAKNQKLAGFSFYIGAIVVLLLTVFIGIFLGEKLTAANAANPITTAAIDIFLGAVLFLLGLRNLVSREESKNNRLLKFVQIKEDSSVFYKFTRYFSIGIIAFLMNFSTAIFVLAVGRVIGVSNQSFGNDLIAILVLILIALLIIEIPLLFFVALPKKAEELTKPIEKWITKHSSLVTGLFCLVIGFYVVYAGIQKLGLS
jgi:threonine/homoserine/homoserine lactone efflux protein